MRKERRVGFFPARPYAPRASVGFEVRGDGCWGFQTFRQGSAGGVAELRGVSLSGSTRRRELQKIRDQWVGAPAATAEHYHPNQYGLNSDQQAYFRTVLERSHVNLVEPALDRLVNSIHSGKIFRRADAAFPKLQRLAKEAAHAASPRLRHGEMLKRPSAWCREGAPTVPNFGSSKRHSIHHTPE